MVRLDGNLATAKAVIQEVVVNLKERFQMAGVGIAVGDDTEELEEKRLAVGAEVAKSVALGIHTASCLWILIHTADDVKTVAVLKVC